MRYHARSYSVATLEEVQAQLTERRSSSPRARRIPDELWDLAVGVCAEHSVCKVSRALRLGFLVEDWPDISFRKNRERD